MSRPRVLVLSPVYPPERGGVEILTRRLAMHLSGWDTRVVTLDHPDARAFDQAAGPPVPLRTRRSIGDRHSLKALTLLALREGLTFRPHVVLSMHVTTAPAAILLQRLARVPFAQYFHAKEFGRHPGLTAAATRRADAVIGVSNYTCGLARDAGAPSGRLHRVVNGVDLPAPSTVARDERPTVITVSRIDDRYKGHDVLTASIALVAARVPRVQWIVVGDGALRDELERGARDLVASGSARFLGNLSDDERDAWLRRAWLFALPSRVPPDLSGGEGFGIACLEANAHGLPVVAGDAGGVPDAVVDGVTASLVDPADPQVVANAIQRILCDRPAADRMGRAGRAHAEGHAWPLVAERVSALLLGIARRPARGRRR